MGRYGSPALLITVDRLNGRSQKLGHLPLGLFQFFPEKFEFCAVHTSSHIFTIDGIVKSPIYCVVVFLSRRGLAGVYEPFYEIITIGAQMLKTNA